MIFSSAENCYVCQQLLFIFVYKYFHIYKQIRIAIWFKTDDKRVYMCVYVKAYLPCPDVSFTPQDDANGNRKLRSCWKGSHLTSSSLDTWATKHCDKSLPFVCIYYHCSFTVGFSLCVCMSVHAQRKRQSALWTEASVLC